MPCSVVLLAVPLVAALTAAPAYSPAGRQPSASEPPVQQETVRLRTQDGAGVLAIYHRPSGRQPKTAFLFMHPRGGNVSHFALDPLARRGYGALGMGSRSMNRTGIHEELLLDVAAGVKFLRDRGAERVILAGHSGGGSLLAFYQAQAETAPPNRIKETPAGDPPDLNKYDLPKADGFVTLNAAEGEGIHFTHHLDPSLVDETDPFSYDRRSTCTTRRTDSASPRKPRSIHPNLSSASARRRRRGDGGWWSSRAPGFVSRTATAG